jgi:hypothetical protein
MPLSLDILKLRLGIPPEDVTKDAMITQVAAQAQGLCEDYCDRRFDLMADEETFGGGRLMTLLLRRWPIAASPPPVITGPNGESPPPLGYWVDYERGMITGPHHCWATVTVAYTGGFDPWPPSLNWAVMNAFDVLWAETPGGALPPGPPAGTGGIRKYSVVGGYSVETTSGEVGEVGANEGTGWGPFPASVIRGLDSYRRESRLGAG